MPEIPREIEDKLFLVNQQMKSSGMRELSDGELRFYAKKLMGQQSIPGIPQDAGGFLPPGGML